MNMKSRSNPRSVCAHSIIATPTYALRKMLRAITCLPLVPVLVLASSLFGNAYADDAIEATHHAIDTATIRLHHFNRLDARLKTDSAELKSQCRYESDIATPPPAHHIALTFDDGPEPVQTEYILEVLQQYGVPATFFMIGSQAQKHPELVRKVMAAGVHQVANHSWDHPNFHSIAPEQQSIEVAHTEDVLGSDMRKKFFRYPYGNSTCETNALLHARGYEIVGWHVDSCDWAFDKDGKVDFKEATSCGVLPQYRADFTGHVLSALRAHNGGVLLMHEIHPNTLKKLAEIVRTALAEGYVFDTVDSPAFQASLR